MAKKYTKKTLSRNTFIAEGDIREVLAVMPPSENGKAHLVVAGPKGGSFKLYLPDWYFDQFGEAINPGDGIDNGGWLDGKFVMPSFWEAEEDE